MRRVWDWLSGCPYLLLTLTMLMWGGNAVASRLAVGEVSPMALTGLRWTVPVAILGVALRRQLLAHRQALAMRWPLVLLMGTLGFTVFNALMYLAAHHTTAVNITILQGSMPVFVLVGALLFYGTRIRGWQIAGMAVTLLGALLVATRADLATLTSFSFNMGDLWMLAACCLYAGYTVALRSKPAVRSNIKQLQFTCFDLSSLDRQTNSSAGAAKPLTTIAAHSTELAQHRSTEQVFRSRAKPADLAIELVYAHRRQL